MIKKMKDIKGDEEEDQEKPEDIDQFWEKNTRYFKQKNHI